MHDSLRLAAKNRIGESMALADRDRRQGNPVGDIANGIDRLDVRLGKSIDLHRTKAIQFDTRFFQPKPSCVWTPAGCEHHLLNIEQRSFRQADMVAC